MPGGKLEQRVRDTGCGEEHIEGDRLSIAERGGMKQSRPPRVGELQRGQVKGCCRADRLTAEPRLATKSRENVPLRVEHRGIARIEDFAAVCPDGSRVAGYGAVEVCGAVLTGPPLTVARIDRRACGQLNNGPVSDHPL